MVLLCIDESGNTSDVIALGLVAISEKAKEPLEQLFTLRSTDPEPIRALYHRDSEIDKRKTGENSKPRLEFKYSDFLNAEKHTNFGIYREFVKEKLRQAAKLNIQIFCSLFDKPDDNDQRIGRINVEAQTLLHRWVGSNLSAAFDKQLKIIVDEQVFHDEKMLQIYERRNKWHCEIFSKSRIGGVVHYGRRENDTPIISRGSREFKPLQFTDFVVGVIREAKMRGRADTIEALRPVLPTGSIRDVRGNYSFMRGLGIM